MIRRLAILVLAVIVLLAVAGAVLYGFRTGLAETALLSRLRSLDVPAPTFRVVDLELDHIRLAHISLGENGELQADSLTVAYDLERLVAGQVDEVSIAGLRLKADLTGDGPVLGSLQPLLATGGGGPPALPAIRLAGGRVDATTPIGPVAIELDGEALPDRDRALNATFTVGVESDLGRLRGLVGVSGRDPQSLTASLVIDEASLRLPGAVVDRLTGTVDFTLANGTPDSLIARLDFAEATLKGADFAGGDIALELTPTEAAVAGTLGTANQALNIALRARLTDYRTQPKLALELSGRITAASPIWALLSLPPPAAGRGLINLRLDGDVPARTDWPGAVDQLLPWLRAADLRGRLDLEVADVAYPGWMGGLDGRVGLDLAFASDVLSIALPADAVFRLADLDRALPESAGLPAELARHLERGLTLTLPDSAEAPFRAELRATADGGEVWLDGSARLATAAGAMADARATGTVAIDQQGALGWLALSKLGLRVRNLALAGVPVSELSWSGTLSGAPSDLAGAGTLDVALGPMRAGNLDLGPLRARLPISGQLAGDRLAARLTDPGTVRIDGAVYDERIELVGPLHVRLVAASVSRDGASADGPATYAHQLALEADDFEARVLRGGKDALTLAAQPGKLRLTGKAGLDGPYRGRLEIEGAGLRLADYQLALEELSATVVPGGDPLVAFRLGALRDLREPALAPPLEISGRLKRDSAGLALAAAAHLPDGSRLAALTARHDPKQGRGEVEVHVDELVFAPDARQPSHLSPTLGLLRAVTGTATATAKARWGGDRIQTEGVLELGDLSFTVDDIAVDGLDARIAFDDLLAPTTPPGQRLTVRRVDPALPVDDVDVRFQLGPGAPVRVLIERASFRTAGGAFAVRDAEFDPSRPDQNFALKVEQLDLAELFEVIDVDGLSASGVVSGDIPLTITAGNFLIRNSRLAANGPGVLRFRSAGARSALQAGGESVELMLQALENFQYETLTVTAEKGATGDANVKISLLGHNPDILEGHPFALNIGFSSNLDTILQALRQGKGLSQEIIRRAWTRRR